MDNIDKMVGYCYSCKEPITIDDDYIKDRGKLYCSYCYKVEHEIVDELDLGK